MAAGINGIPNPVLDTTGYLVADQNDAMSRYSEALLMVDAGYKEQQYWLAVYNRAQQCGVRGLTIQEITLQLDKVSQRLQNLQKISLQDATSNIKREVNSIVKASERFKVSS